MISYQMNAYSLDVISYTCNLFLRRSVCISCLALEISRYMTGGEHKVAYFDFKKSGYRFAYLHIHLPGALWSWLCLSACCYTCKEQADWAAALRGSFLPQLGSSNIKFWPWCQGGRICCSIRWQIWLIQAENNCSMFLAVFIYGALSPLLFAHLCKFLFRYFSKSNSLGLG